jgi:hypothetical protein
MPAIAKKIDPAALHAAAHDAGMAAAAAHTPVAMIVGQADGLSDRFAPGAKLYHVPGGVCGFAWVNVKPATQPFAKWAKKAGLARPSYYGGYDISVREFGQSMTTKEAYAHAYAKVLRDNGVKAYPNSRMD